MVKKISTIILFVLPFLFLLILLAHPDQSFTQDLGRHIKMGEIILQCRCVPHTNLFSYTQTNHSFINHHWFSEVVFFLLYSTFGAHALLFLKVFLILLSFGIVYKLAFKISPFWSVSLAIPYIYMFSERFDTRPEMFSFVFISLFVFLLYKFRETRNIQYLIALPLIELFWVNMHIYFVLGLILFGAFVLEELIKKRKKIDKNILFIFIATLIVIFLNPNGIMGAIQPIIILQQYGYTIVENQNIFFLNSFFFNPHILVFEILAGVLLCLFFLARKSLVLFPTLISVFALVMSADMIRNFPLFVLITFAYFVTLTATMEKHYFQRSGIRLLMGFGMGVFFVVVSFQNITAPFVGYTFAKGAENAVRFYKQNSLKGNIFNNFDIGSYLIFTLYPTEKVYVDGRPEAYSLDFFNRYKQIQEDPSRFQVEAKLDNINTIFFAHTDITPWAQKFVSSIIKDPEWVTVYVDERIIILVRNIPENASLIAKYKKTLPE